MDLLHNTITLSSITNFLEAGALLRHGDQWILIEGPFSPVSDANSDEITIFCPDFYDLHSALPLKGVKVFHLSTTELKKNCETFLSKQEKIRPLLGKAEWVEPQKSDFAQAFAMTQERITKGDLAKAVPVVFTRSAQTVTPEEKARMILHLLEAPPALFVYGFWQNGAGFLGATPELLFDYSGGTLKTMALAGTCPKSESSERDSLLKDAKEMQEHTIVLDDLKNILQPFGVMKTIGPRIVELPTLYHLKTDLEIECHLQPDFIALIEKLHPTPALGVAPRTVDYNWMQSFPGQQGRGRFGAPFAFLSSKEALCLVAIRNLQWNEIQSMIGSGCGVVAASEVEREWRELYQKRLSVRKILGLEI